MYSINSQQHYLPIAVWNDLLLLDVPVEVLQLLLVLLQAAARAQIYAWHTVVVFVLTIITAIQGHYLVLKWRRYYVKYAEWLPILDLFYNSFNWNTCKSCHFLGTWLTVENWKTIEVFYLNFILKIDFFASFCIFFHLNINTKIRNENQLLNVRTDKTSYRD